MITGAAVSVVPVLVHVITGVLAQVPPANTPAGTPTLDEVLTNLRNWITRVLAAAAVVSLSVAGLRYVASQGDPEEIGKAKTAIKAAAAGFILAALAPLAVEILRSIVTK